MAINDIKNNNINGIIIVNKPCGMTSFDCVFKVRKALGVKKAGHTGTLDPNATGVLPICLGKSTKAVSMVQEGSKVYKAEMILGLETDTYDVTGEVLRDIRAQLIVKDDIPSDNNTHLFATDAKPEVTVSDDGSEEKSARVVVTEDMLLKAIAGFIGEQDQMPPIYSAKKVNGKKLYEYAREGQEVEIRPTHINIEKIDLLSFDGKRAEIRVFCSKGTYIRSLIHDIGKVLGCGAAMGDLLRERTGNFSIEDAVTLDEIYENIINDSKFADDPDHAKENDGRQFTDSPDKIKENVGKKFTDFLQKKIIPTSEIFPYASLHVKNAYEKNALNGMKLYPVDFEEGIGEFTDEYYKIFMKDDFFVGIYKRDGEFLRPFKMFLIDESFQ